MDLVNMKMTSAQREGLVPTADAGKEQYPWGLKIHLDGEGISKLGLTDLPEVGTVMTIEAKVKVTSVSINDQEGGKTRRDIDLQITDMAIGAEDEKKSPAEALYPSQK